MKVIARKKSVFLKPYVKEKKTMSGFIIPAAVGEAQPMVLGKICTMGIDQDIMFDDAYGRQIPFKDGQVVVYEKSRGTPITIDGEDLICIGKEFIVALVNDYE